MKRFIFIITTVLFILGMGSWALWAESSTPSSTFKEFHRLIVKRDIQGSWDYLSVDTKEKIVTNVKMVAGKIIDLKGLTDDPKVLQIVNIMLTGMHLDDVSGDIDCWGAILTEASETGKAIYLSPKLEVTGEEIEENKATIYIQYESVTGTVNMVREDGQWKVENPYVIQLAECGWVVDMTIGVCILGPDGILSARSQKTKPDYNYPKPSFPVEVRRYDPPIRIDAM